MARNQGYKQMVPSEKKRKSVTLGVATRSPVRSARSQSCLRYGLEAAQAARTTDWNTVISLGGSGFTVFECKMNPRRMAILYG